MNRPWIAVAGIVWIGLVTASFFLNNQSYFAGKFAVMGRFLGGSP